MASQPTDATGGEATGHETVRLHLRVLGQDRRVELSVGLGPRRLVDLLPVAYQLSEQLMAAALDQTRAGGKQPSCGPACGACCRQLVAISAVEAQGLAELVARLPPVRQAVIRERFADAIRQMEAAGLLDPAAPKGDRPIVGRGMASVEAALREVGQRYFALQIACPFLEDESCGIHPERPLVCREYLVASSADRCKRLYVDEIDVIPVPRRLGDSLMRTAHEIADAPLEKIPLVLSLEWQEARRAEQAPVLTVRTNGVKQVQTFANQV